MTLPAKFAALRTETNYMWLHCTRAAEPPWTGHELPCTGNPVQLLCRALQLAPRSYQVFMLAAASPEEPLTVSCGEDTIDSDVSDSDGEVGYVEASFEDIPALTDAMRQFAVAEQLRVDLSPDQRTIVIRRLDE